MLHYSLNCLFAGREKSTTGGVETESVACERCAGRNKSRSERRKRKQEERAEQQQQQQSEEQQQQQSEEQQQQQQSTE